MNPNMNFYQNNIYQNNIQQQNPNYLNNNVSPYQNYNYNDSMA